MNRHFNYQLEHFPIFFNSYIIISQNESYRTYIYKKKILNLVASTDLSVQFSLQDAANSLIYDRSHILEPTTIPSRSF